MRTEVFKKIEEIPRDVWERVYPRTLENYSFLKTLDESHFEQFSFRYILVYDGEILKGAAVCFLVDYPLDTTVLGPLRVFTDRLKKIIPRLFTVRAVVCGLPMDPGRIGISGDPEKVIEAICERMEKIAREENAPIVSFKDFDSTYDASLARLQEKGFFKINSLPSAEMDIDFISFDQYLRTLSRASRDGLRRKFKKVDGLVKIEMEAACALSDELSAGIYRLYRQTVDKHQMSFETAPPEFFRNITRNMPAEAKYFLWRVEGKIAAFALCISSQGVFSDYYLGFDYSVAYKYHLYFIRIRDLMKWCMANGIKRYEFGVTDYEAKKRLGFRFRRLYLYVKCRNRMLNPLFWALCRFLEPENFDPVLKKIIRSDRNDIYCGSARLRIK